MTCCCMLQIFFAESYGCEVLEIPLGQCHEYQSYMPSIDCIYILKSCLHLFWSRLETRTHGEYADETYR